MGVSKMIDRKFVPPTDEEIAARKEMYDKAEELGIDLMSFDDTVDNDLLRHDIRKAIVYLGQGKEVPNDIKERLLKQKEQNALNTDTKPCLVEK
jgi:N-acyl-D-aspartate/D-glutamate deacylase